MADKLCSFILLYALAISLCSMLSFGGGFFAENMKEQQGSTALGSVKQCYLFDTAGRSYILPHDLPPYLSILKFGFLPHTLVGECLNDHRPGEVFGDLHELSVCNCLNWKQTYDFVNFIGDVMDPLVTLQMSTENLISSKQQCDSPLCSCLFSADSRWRCMMPPESKKNLLPALEHLYLECGTVGEPEASNEVDEVLARFSDVTLNHLMTVQLGGVVGIKFEC
ncbi:hypothetical protein HAX54_015451 [Datura stramonium]|uniref:Uncharacterized protein n=1 Tax=Datura stramonium TaxID=4076 RepID=A0ABS8TS18_DATST|nr:hypothetical protein [Datura stramonium]